MSSVLTLSGLNYQRGNPLGGQIRTLQTELAELRKEIASLKANGVGATPQVVQGPPGPAGPAGPPGPKGDKGDKGEPGPMTYIAMPPQMAMPAATATAPVAVASQAPAAQ